VTFGQGIKKPFEKKRLRGLIRVPTVPTNLLTIELGEEHINKRKTQG
jgi:hypothetical protein